MKLSLNVEADAISVQALNMGRICVDIDGIEWSELIAAVNQTGRTLQEADETKAVSADVPPPFTSLPGMCCSTAHITEEDNHLLHMLSQQLLDYGNAEWIHFTGSGYLIRLEAWSFPVLRLKRLGLSKACRRLVVTLIRRYAIGILHLDAFGELLPGFEIFDW
ncbi:hypothetical protein DNM18_21560 [Salmonella enterica subsp. enterica]|nr:hypothetical protein [Salmonella enterica subsp. enterica serovar Poona]EDU4887093.1 hypothetical protein [Salmonella enterica subsp. enterica serovar Java]